MTYEVPIPTVPTFVRKITERSDLMDPTHVEELMIHLFSSAKRLRFARGPFRIARVRPGLAIPGHGDLGFGPLGAFDHGDLLPGLHIPMHPHHNDEILSYLVEGELIHRGSHGYEARVTPQNLMVMNAGAEIWHEERMDEAGPETHMLQIFVRPHTPELDSHVSFGDPGNLIAGAWRPIAGPQGPLVVRNWVWTFDRQAQAEEDFTLPGPPEDGLAAWVYVFSGELQGEGFTLSTGDGFALLPGDEPPQVPRPTPAWCFFG